MESELQLSDIFIITHPDEAARILERFDPGEIAEVLTRLEVGEAGAAALQQMTPTVSAEVLGRLDPDTAEKMISGLPLQIAAALLRRLESDHRDRVLSSLSKELNGSLRLLLRCPENTAGALMNPRALVLPVEVRVNEAIEAVRRSPHHALHYLYIVNGDHRLVGVVTLRELMDAGVDEPLESIMQFPVETLSVHADRAAIISHPGWRNYHKLPVCDDGGVFAGVIGYKTLRGLERRGRRPDWARQTVGLTLVFGEIYWKGLLAGLQGVVALASALGTPGMNRTDTKENNDAQRS